MRRHYRGFPCLCANSRRHRRTGSTAGLISFASMTPAAGVRENKKMSEEEEREGGDGGDGDMVVKGRT